MPDLSLLYIESRQAAEDSKPLSPEALEELRRQQEAFGIPLGEMNLPSEPPAPSPPRGPTPGAAESAAKGIKHGVVGLAESAGTVTEIAGEMTGFEGLKEAGRTARDFWSNIGKAYEPDKSISGAVMDDPGLLLEPAWWAYTVADTLPSFAASIVPAFGAGRAIQLGGRALKLTPTLISKLAKIGAAISGGAAGGALEGSQTYKSVLDRGGNPDQAVKAAMMMTAASGALNSISLGKMQTRLAGKSRFFDALLSGGVEGITEWLEEPSEWFIERAIDDGSPGYVPPTVPELKDKMRQGVNVFFPSAVLGAGGAVMAGADVKAAREHLAAKLSEERGSFSTEEKGRFPGFPEDKGLTFNMATGEDVKAAGKILLLDLWKDIEYRQSHEQTVEGAKQLLEEGTVSIDSLLSRKPGEAFGSAREAHAAEKLTVGVWEHMVEAIRLHDEGKISDGELQNSISLSAALTSKLYGGVSEAARIVEQRSIGAEGSREWMDAGKDIFDNIVDLTGETGIHLGELKAKLKALPTPEHFADLARKMDQITGKDMFIEAWYGSLLSNPVTHAANFIGNTVALFAAIPERGIASLSHRMFGKSEGVVPGETYALLYGLTSGMVDALRTAGKTAVTGETAFGRERMERRTRAPAITAENLNASGAIGYAIDLLGMAIRGPGRALLASDEFFKAVNYRMEIHAQAYRQAYAEGWGGEELAQRMADMVENPPDSIHAMSADWANYQTFTNALGKVGSSLVSLSNAHPSIKLILPFVATPTNILKYTFQRIGPLSYALKSTREDISAGGARRDLAIARISLGSMVMATAATLAAAGLITGGGPSDKDLRETKRRTGWQPYSIKIGKKYYSFARFEPFATLFGMTADAVEIMGQRTDIEVETIAKALTLSFAKNMTNKTYLTGLSDALEAITNPDRSGDRFIRRLIGSVIPSGVAQVKRITDPTMRDTSGPTSRAGDTPLIREARGILNELRNRTPGFSKDLPPRRNLWGEPILLEGALGPDIISPIYQSTIKDSPVDEEILRLGVKLSMPPRYMFGSRPSEDIPIRDESLRSGIPLTPKEYDFLVQVAAGLAVKVEEQEYRVSDQTLKETLLGRIKDPGYKGMTDGPDGGKALMIRAIVTAYRDAAKSLLFEASPELRQLYEQKIEERAQALVGAD